MIADRWNHGADYSAIAEAAVDIVAEHVRASGVAMDDRIAGAFAELMAQRLDDDVELEPTPAHAAAAYERARCLGASPLEALERARVDDGQMTLADALEDAAGVRS